MALPANIDDRWYQVFVDDSGAVSVNTAEAAGTPTGTLPDNLFDRFYQAFVLDASGAVALRIVYVSA